MLNEDIFDALVEEIERGGGELFPEAHVGTPLIYEMSGKHGRKVKRETHTQGCGASALVRIPYQPAAFSAGPEAATGKNRPIVDNLNDEARDHVFCLICDRVDAWPRFAHLQPEEAV